MTKARKSKLLILAIVSVLSIITLALVGCFPFGDSSGGKPSFGGGDDSITTSDTTANAYKSAISKSKAGVVCIRASNAVGYGNASGFFVTDNGYILTNAHALYGSFPFTKFEIKVLNDDNETYAKYSAEPAPLLPTHLPYDLALLKITNAPAGTRFHALTFADSSNVAMGDPCVMIGNPKGLGLLAHSAMVGNPSVIVDNSSLNFPVLAVETPVNDGNSGGPLINVSGEVIGVITSRLLIRGGEVDDGIYNLGYAQKSNDALIYLHACSVLDGLIK